MDGMTEQAANSVLHRKANAGRDGAGSRTMSPAKALRLSLAREADRLLDLALTVATVEQQRLAQSGIQAAFDGDGLLVLLDGAEGARGALMADSQVMAALIEVQTTGQVRRGTSAKRPVTRTDAAMAAPLVDALLAAYEAQMRDWQPLRPAQGLAFGDLIEDARALPLLLMDPDYDLFRLTLDLADGAKTGCLQLLLPVPPAPRRTGRAAGAQAVDRARPDLAEVALGAPVTLDAVLARINLTLGEVCGLRQGACLPIDPARLNRTELLAARGHPAGRVRLGQMNGWRAVRFIGLDEPESETAASPAAPAIPAPGPARDDDTPPPETG